MDVEYAVIEPRFQQLRGNILHDLNVLLQSQSSVNYTAALLIACACEALAWFRYGDKYKGDKFLSEMMLPSQWQPAAKSLYNALRNGLAHAFETMTIVVGPRQFEIGVDWGRHTHLTCDPTHSLLYLNIFTMAEDLNQAINRYEEELKTSGEARAKFHGTILRMKNSFRKDVSTNPRERPVWEELLK